MEIAYQSKVEYIDHMGNDDSVVNAARVSFDKLAKNYTKEQNERLIAYLAKHNHWSPFAHTSISIRVSAPIFVARQLGKHQVGLVWNEVSRRYVDEEPLVFLPTEWRGKPINAKQGSSGGLPDQLSPNEIATLASMYALDAYNGLLNLGVAPEQARMVLPQNMMTTWVWTGSLLAFHRVFKQRTDDHAQAETQQVASKIGVICNEIFPTSWSALCNTGSHS